MTTQISGISALDKNIQIPFYPSESWDVNSGDIIDPATTPLVSQNGTYFSWIQAFFSATDIPAPVLAVYSGKKQADGTPIVSPVRFAYSGERIPFKGLLILTTGVDVRGNTITSTPVGASPTTDITKITVYGGTQ